MKISIKLFKLSILMHLIQTKMFHRESVRVNKDLSKIFRVQLSIILKIQ